jgi:hypothetical protein
MQKQGTGLSAQGSESRVRATPSNRPEPTHLFSSERVLELEAENARLKSLIGELLVTNQLLRECREQVAEMKGPEINGLEINV